MQRFSGSFRRRLTVIASLAFGLLVVTGGAKSDAASGSCRFPSSIDQFVYGRTKPSRIYGANEVLLASMSDFLHRFRAENRPCYDSWATDGCSVPTPLSPEPAFKNSCLRHDWGYRTLKASDAHYGRRRLWNRPNKAAIDTRFLYDMRHKCDAMNLFPFEEKRCKDKASAYYRAVAKYGGFNTYEYWVEYLMPY